MYWNNRFSYPKSMSSIINGSRHYSIKDQNLPSVTSFLNATESDQKKARELHGLTRSLINNIDTDYTGNTKTTNTINKEKYDGL